MFEKLRRQAQANTVQRNKQLGSDSFQFTESGEPAVRALAFTVIATQSPNRANFELKGQTIHASVGNGGSPLQATLTLTDDGNCKIKVGKDELEPWQFLRLVLEPLFFGDDAGV